MAETPITPALSPKRLAGPRPSYRFVLMRVGTRAIVSGIFPPEDAPIHRQAAQEIANRAAPEFRSAYMAELEATTQRLLYGDPSAPTPVGILHANSPIAAVLPNE